MDTDAMEAREEEARGFIDRVAGTFAPAFPRDGTGLTGWYTGGMPSGATPMDARQNFADIQRAGYVAAERARIEQAQGSRDPPSWATASASGAPYAGVGLGRAVGAY